jgi:signal transduction histidine kinase
MTASTAVRLSLLFLVLFMLTAIVLVFYVTSFSVRVIQAQSRSVIQTEVGIMARAFERGGLPALVRQMDRAGRQPGAPLYLLADPSGRIFAGNVLSVAPGVLDKPGWVMQPFSYERFDNGDGEGHQAIARIIRMPNGLTLMIGRDVGEPERFRGIIRQALALALGIMTVGAFLIWFFIGRRALKRVDAISADSSAIIAGDLSRRLPVNGSGDEFDRLAASLNAQIDRIEKLDSGVRDVANNVAHDLRTPLTRLRTRAERALETAKGTRELRAALEGCVAESDQLIRTFNALLMISRLEAGSRLDNRNPEALDAILADVVELYEPTAEETGVALERGAVEAWVAPVHRELIAQALSNLVENALRYGAGGTPPKVRLSLTKVGPDAVFEVADNGQGIDPARLASVTDRFARIDASRTAPGAGLGLSLVKAIAEAHGGALALENRQPGLAARLRIPLEARA